LFHPTINVRILALLCIYVSFLARKLKPHYPQAFFTASKAPATPLEGFLLSRKDVAVQKKDFLKPRMNVAV